MQLFVSRASGFVSGGVCKSCAAFSDIPVCTDAERGDVPCLWVARLWRETQNPRINHGMLSVGRNLPPSRVPQGLIQPGLEVTWEWISGSYWHLVETKIQMQTELELNPSFEVILNFQLRALPAWSTGRSAAGVSSAEDRQMHLKLEEQPSIPFCWISTCYLNGKQNSFCLQGVVPRLCALYSTKRL